MIGVVALGCTDRRRPGRCAPSAIDRSRPGSAARHQRIKPFTPKHNGKVERYQRTLAEEVLYARPYANENERTAAIAVWNIHYNYHRPQTAAGNQPPATRLHQGVTNVMRSYTYTGRGNPLSRTSAPSPDGVVSRARWWWPDTITSWWDPIAQAERERDAAHDCVRAVEAARWFSHDVAHATGLTYDSIRTYRKLHKLPRQTERPELMAAVVPGGTRRRSSDGTGPDRSAVPDRVRAVRPMPAVTTPTDQYVYSALDLYV